MVASSHHGLVETELLAELPGAHDDLLSSGTSDGNHKELKQLMGECVVDMRSLEGNLANMYIKTMVDSLNEVLDEYFEEDGTDWTNAPLPTGIRDSAFEIIPVLVSLL